MDQALKQFAQYDVQAEQSFEEQVSEFESPRQHGDYEGTINYTLSAQSLYLLHRLAELEIYGESIGEVGARFVDQALQGFVDRLASLSAEISQSNLENEAGKLAFKVITGPALFFVFVMVLLNADGWFLSSASKHTGSVTCLNPTQALRVGLRAVSQARHRFRRRMTTPCVNWIKTWNARSVAFELMRPQSFTWAKYHIGF